MVFLALRTVLLAYLVLVLLAFVAQRRLIFPATRDVYRNPAAYGWEYEEVFLPVHGKVTQLWFIPCENARGTFLISHGNAGNIANRLETADLFHSMGFNVLLYDYGGYGKSTGKPSEKRCCADARAAWRYLTEDRGIPPEQIVLFGRSLGGAVSADLACQVSARAVILESTFLSTPRLAQKLYPFLPAKFLVRHKFDTAQKMPRIDTPLLVIHSPEDEIVPFRHGRKLYELANEPKQFLEIHGGHNEGFILSTSIYRKGIEDFLDPLLPPKQPENSR